MAAAQCRGVQHAVVHEASGRRIGYGEIASAAAALSVPSQDAVKLKDRSNWRLIGKAVPSLTVPKIIRGEGTFGIDVQLPEMLHAVIARPPQVFGNVKTVDDRATLQVPGVVRTVRLNSPQAPRCVQGAGRSRSSPAIPGRPSVAGKRSRSRGTRDRMPIMSQPRAVPAMPPSAGCGAPQPWRCRGSLRAGGAALSADYYVPHLAQSPIEPPAATARWDGARWSAGDVYRIRRRRAVRWLKPVAWMRMM